MSRQTDVVNAIYAAFGRGDVPAILEHLRDDVEWEHDTVEQGLPYILPGRGRELVARFFEVAGRELAFRRFEVTNVLEGGAQVAAVCAVEGVAKRTGRSFADLEVHLWTFDAAGRVSRFKHVIDTHRHLAAQLPQT